MCDHDDLTINDNDKWNYDDQKYKNDDLTYYDNYKCGDNHFYVDDSDKHKVLHEIGSFCMNQANIFKMLHKVLRNLICCIKWGSILEFFSELSSIHLFFEGFPCIQLIWYSETLNKSQATLFIVYEHM